MAPQNIVAILVTLDVVFQARGLFDWPDASPLLNASALSNICTKLIALDKFQFDKLWLNAVHVLNIPLKLVTLLTFQFPTSWLKLISNATEPSLPNKNSISVTLETFQPPIG